MCKKADVLLSCGRYHLFVNGVVVATEGDKCRDPKIDDKFWNKKSLEQAKEIINND